jgi:CheY-like chemotaxis protein
MTVEMARIQTDCKKGFRRRRRAVPESPAASAKIVIIDDEPINIKVARKHLQGVGYQNFITTTDSSTALELIDPRAPDVVLLDVMMPQVVNGIDILRAVRADPQLMHIPVLILTASTDAQTKLAARWNRAPPTFWPSRSTQAT